MKKRLLTYKLYKTIFCFVAFMFLSSSAMAQVARISNSGGNWNDAARWTPNGVPTALDDVTIAHNVTINANNLECANLTVNAGVTLNHNSGGGGERFTVNGNFIVNGTYNQNNNAGRPTYIFGDFIINGTYTTSGQGDARQHIIMRKGGATIGGTGAAMSGSNVFCHLTIDLTDTSGGNYVTLARNITIGAENNSPNLNLTNGHLLASGRTITSGSDNNLIINANNGYNFVSDASYCSDQKGPNLVINGTSGRGVEVNGTLTINNLTFTSNNASFPRNTGAQITVNGNFSRTIENSPTINAAFNWGPESSYSVSNTSWSLGSSPRGEWNGVINANAPATINSVVNEAKVPCGRTVRVTALASDAVGATAYRLRAYNLECGAGNYAWGIGSTTLTSTGNDTYDVYTSGTYWVACSDLADPVSTNPLTITPRISSTSATNEAGTTTLKAIGLGAPNDDYEWGVGTTCGTTPRDTISESNEYSVMISSSIVYWARKVENPCNNGVTSATISFTIPKDFTSSKGFSFCEGVSTILTASGMGSPTDVYRWTEQKLTPTAGPVVILSERTVSIEVLPSLLPDYSGTIRYTVENLTTHETESRVITLTDCCGTTGAFSVSQVCNPITVDATRDEAEWSISPTMPISSVNYDWGCTTPNPAGEWKMLYDDDGNVYMYIRVFDRGTPVPPSGNRWESSSAEIYFEAGAGCEGKTLQLGIPYSPSNPRQYLYNNIDCGDWELKVEDIAISAWNGTYWDIEIKFNAGVNQFDFTDRVRMEVGINRSITGTNRCAQFFTWTSGSTDVFTNIGAMRYVTTTAACTSVRSNKKVACEGSTVELNTRLEAEPYAPAKSTAYTWQYCTGTNCTNALADDGNWLTITGLENTAEIVTVTAAFGGASSIYYRALYNKSDGTKAYTCPVEVNKGSLEIEASSNVSICEGGNITIDGSIVTGTAWLWGWKKGSTDDYTQADEWVVDLSDEPADMTYSKTGAAGDTGYYFFVAVGQCEAASQGVQVTVNNSSQADLRLTPTSQQICSGSSSRNITIEGGTASTFDWRIVVSGGSLDGFNASQTGTAATSISGQQLTLASGEITAATITYYITPNGIDGCSTDGSEFPVTVTVNTKPTIEIATSNTPVCEGETLNLQLTTNGTSYIWTGPNNFTSSDQNPSISNVTTEAVGTYKIVVSSAAGCKDSTTTLVAVNPKPTLTNHMAPDHCSGELHAEINLTSLLAGATFSWTTATTGNIVAGFTTSAIGVTTIPAYEYVTLSATATDTVIYRITPTLNQCAGDEIEYKIPVKICQDLNLEPEISSPICKDETTIVSIVAGNHAGVVANDVTVQLEPLPAGLEYVSTIKGTYSSATRIWTIGTIPEKVGTVPGTDTLKIVVRGIAAGNNQEILSYISYANSGSIDYANYAAVTEGNHKATNAVTVDALPTITPITGGDAVCVGKELQLSSTPTGGTWKIVNSTATGTTINGSSGLLTAGSTAGTLTVRYIVTNISGCVDSVSLAVTVNALPIITPITGGDAVCVGKELQLSSTPTGGTWKIVNSTATGTTINGSSGLLTAGSTAGTLTVRYIVTNISGCVDSVALPVTVNDIPIITPITGGDAVCVGKEMQLSSTPTGGTWKIVNNTAVGTAIDNSGLLTAGNTAGTLTVRYIVTNISGCVDSVALPVTVNDIPIITPITGGDAVCVGKEMQLSSTPTGGTWKIVNNTAVGTAIDNSGLLTAGNTAGTLTVRYIVTNISGCVDSVSLPVTINALPTITPITGGDAVCVDKELQLSSTPTGGTWKIVNSTAVGTAIDNSGLLTAGNTAGTLTVRYIVTNISGCADSVALPVTVNDIPTITPITGGDAVCVGKEMQLSSTPTGGTWKIVNSTAVGTAIDNSGLLTAGNTASTLTVRYIVTNISGCVDSVSLPVTVNDIPTITPITGGDAVCVGKEMQLSSTPTGGTWKIVNSTAVGTAIDNSGLLTAGNTAGTLTVRYIVTNISGCADSVALTVTVNDIPTITPITGGDAVCVGKEMQLSSTPTGGTWKIVNNTAVGTAIDNSSLLIAGNTAGTLTVRYIVTNISGCVDSVSLPVTINALPTITPITGGDAVCLGKDLQLSSTPSGGTWKIVNNTAVGTTIDNSGLLTADNTVGTLTVRYIVTNVSGCVDSVALTVTVNDCKSNPPSVVYHTEDCQSDPECDEQPNCWQTGDCANGKVPAPYGHYNACAVELGGKIPFAHLVVVPDRAGLKFYNVPTGGTPLTNAEDLGFNPSVVGTTEVWVTYTEPEPHKTESERIKLIIKVHQSVEDLELIYEKLHHDNTGYVSPGQEVVFRAITTASGVNYTWTDSKNANLPNAVEHALRLYKDYKITVSVANNICPAVTKTITVPVVWPTAITPYDLDGYNDDFLVGTDIFMTIFNRYGQKVYEGRSGWDGTYRGKTADPGTYYYVAELPDGDVKKGAIEVVRMK